MNWAYFVYGLITWQLGSMLSKVIRQELHERRERRFLKFVEVTFENKERLHYIALSTSDKESFQKITRQIQEEFDVSDEKISELLKDEPRR